MARSASAAGCRREALLLPVISDAAAAFAEAAPNRRLARKRPAAPVAGPLAPKQIVRVRCAHRGDPAPDGPLADSALRCHLSDVLGGPSLAADCPVSALHLVDHDPGDSAHVLAFDLDHRVCEALGDHRLDTNGIVPADANIADAHFARHAAPMGEWRFAVLHDLKSKSCARVTHSAPTPNARSSRS